MSNVSNTSGASVVDGLKFLFRGYEHDRMQLEYEKIFDAVQQATGLPTATLNRLIKFKVVRGEKSTHGALHSLMLVGDAARVYQKLPWRLSGALVEMHVKAYLVERAEGSLEWFQDAIWNAPTVISVSFVKSKPMKNRPKASGDKGVRIGSRKSDKHAVVYRRQKENPGFEARLRDAELRSAVQRVEMVRASMKETGDELDDAASWLTLKVMVARAGYSYAFKLLRQMGVNIAEYFSEVCASPELGTAHMCQPLDPDEELSAIVPLLD